MSHEKKTINFKHTQAKANILLALSNCTIHFPTFAYFLIEY